MAIPKQKFREAVFQILYSADFAAVCDEMIFFMMEELASTRKAMMEAKQRSDQILLHLEQIDPMIIEASTGYSFERISKVERTILRLGLFELFFDPSIPPKVVIAEAIRLCRKFGTPESAQFINAILDGVYKKHASSLSKLPQLV